MVATYPVNILTIGSLQRTKLRRGPEKMDIPWTDRLGWLGKLPTTTC